MLNDAQIAEYHDKGYVVPDFRLPEDQLEEIRGRHTALLKRHPEFRDNASVLLSYDLSFLNYAREPAILDMVEQLIGPDICLWNMSFFAKPALNGKKTPWHQDGQYWPIRPLASCSVWIAIDDVGVENGCMRVIPGSHRNEGLLRHHLNTSDDLTLNQELDEDQFDEEDAVDIVLKPGQMSFHDINLVHGSRHNRSRNRRAGFVLRYMPTTSHFDRELGQKFEQGSSVVNFSERALYLARGVDQCGLNDFEIGHLSS